MESSLRPRDDAEESSTTCWKRSVRASVRGIAATDSLAGVLRTPELDCIIERLPDEYGEVLQPLVGR